MDGVTLTPLREIANDKGNIFHGMKCSEATFHSFGEAYFSTVNKGAIKGWKKHNKMILNVVVPYGEIEVVLYNEVSDNFYSVVLSRSNYKRLTVAPGLWMAFRGMAEENILLNIASIEHDPTEAEVKELDKIKYDW